MRRFVGGAIVLAGALLGSGSACDRDRDRAGGAKPRIKSVARLDGSPRRGVTEIKLDAKFRPVAGQTIYVPVYSHVYTSSDARPFSLAVTLSARNTDQAQPIILASVRYHDRDGRLVRRFLDQPLRIAPLAAMDFFLEESDLSGGSSANFVLEWVADTAVSPPVVEAVMIGTASTQGISFVCPGRVVAERKGPTNPS